jgi:hypothetical protein
MFSEVSCTLHPASPKVVNTLPNYSTTKKSGCVCVCVRVRVCAAACNFITSLWNHHHNQYIRRVPQATPLKPHPSHPYLLTTTNPIPRSVITLFQECCKNRIMQIAFFFHYVYFLWCSSTLLCVSIVLHFIL